MMTTLRPRGRASNLQRVVGDVGAGQQRRGSVTRIRATSGVRDVFADAHHDRGMASWRHVRAPSPRNAGVRWYQPDEVATAATLPGSSSPGCSTPGRTALRRRRRRRRQQRRGTVRSAPRAAPTTAMFAEEPEPRVQGGSSGTPPADRLDLRVIRRHAGSAIAPRVAFQLRRPDVRPPLTLPGPVERTSAARPRA